MNVHRWVRLVVLSIAVVSAAFVLPASLPSRPHAAYACAGMPGAVGGDWCRPPVLRP